ncbi:aminotransferase class I/II-fold pyridoxal phosphate-dependent enzyme [Stenotrophomonas sp. 278]|uniref:pyridoxal phosphate-dependent aminotransferase n=1 Tax=Stenotrophomonas sp. 278 TaxID=2479851 RepID=UPI000F67CA31|nr:aminotransferase class I/II-fold pyridoxal phosphate-dependent enzyme [Stenotrophomonas sp. 278]RRU15100.1 aminotransferase class I/II-fold pyridoxal phosphate-dependent enzyme [Stenotrophomonas sp. 278]
MKGSALRLDSAIYEMPENDLPGLCQLHLNENLFASTIAAEDRLAARCFAAQSGRLNRYPVQGADRLKVELARHASCAPEQVVVGNGSSELLRLLFISLLGKCERVLLPEPSWSFYRVCAQLVGGEIFTYPLLNGKGCYVYDLSEIKCRIQSCNPRVVIVCSPNNPTGNSINADELLELVDAYRDVSFVVDQAYCGFSDDDGGSIRILQKAARRSNLFVTRTFSKFLGLADIRVGYLVCNAKWALTMSAMSPVFGISTLNQDLAISRLNDAPLHELIRSEFYKVRSYVFDELRRMDGVDPYWTDANFMLMRIAEGEVDVCSELRSCGFVVKREVIESAGTYLRVTIADSDTMTKLLNALRTALEVRNEMHG